MRKKLNRLFAFLCALVITTSSVLSGSVLSSVKAADETNLMSMATLSSTTLLAGSTLSALTDNHKVWWSGDTTNYPYTAGAIADYTADNGMAYFQADFSEELSLGQVRLYFRCDTTSEHPQDIAVDVKLSNGTWERVAEMHDISYAEGGGYLVAQGLSSAANAFYLPMNFETVKCVGFRISANGQRTLDEKGNKGNFRVVEMEAYSSYPSGQSVTGTTADTEEKYNIPNIVADYTGINLMDYATLSSTTVLQGNLNALVNGKKTWWNGSGNSDYNAEIGVAVDYTSEDGLAYYQADFDRELPLGQVQLYIYSAVGNERPQDIAVDVQLADGTWERVAEMHDINYAESGGDMTLKWVVANCSSFYLAMNFETVDCVGFRVSANGQRTLDENGGKGNFRLVEIEAYNEYPSGQSVTGITADAEEKYNIPNIAADYTGINLMDYATLSSTTVLQGNLNALVNGKKTWWNGSGNSDYNAEIGVAVDYTSEDGLAYYQADFDRELPLGQVQLYIYSAVGNERPQDIAVDVQLADGTWVRVAEMHDINYAESGGDMTLKWVVANCSSFYLAMNFETVDCVGFRVSANGQRTLDENGGKGNFRLVEIEAYNEYPSGQSVTGTTKDAEEAYNIPEIVVSNPDVEPDDEPDDEPEELVNLMDLATISSTTVLQSNLDVLTNGKKTWWNGTSDSSLNSEIGVAVDYTGTDNIAYYQADFEEAVTLGQVRLYQYIEVANERPQDIAVDVQLADGTWVRVAERHDINYAENGGDMTLEWVGSPANAFYLSMDFESVECVAFRVSANGQRTADENGHKGNFRLVEIEAYASGNGITGITPDAEEAYNIPEIVVSNPDVNPDDNPDDNPDVNPDDDPEEEPEDEPVNLMDLATISSTTVLQSNLDVLTNGKKTWWNGTSDSSLNPEIGVAVDYTGTDNIAYYQADFEEAVTLGQVRLYQYIEVANERPQDIAVDVKLADGTWVRVAERHDINYAENGGDMTLEWVGSPANAFYLSMDFESVECVAFRVSANGQRTADENGHKGNFRLVEIEAYASGNGITGVTQDDEDAYNIPLPSEAKEEDKELDADNLMSLATLSSTTVLQKDLSALTNGKKTWWNGTENSELNPEIGVAVGYDGFGGYAYYQADFEESVSLGQIRLYLYIEVADERPYDIVVDVKLPDGTWKRVAERHDINYAETGGDMTLEWVGSPANAFYLSMDFETIDCTAFRVTANGQRTADKNGHMGNFRLVEIEAYSKGNTSTGTEQDANEAYNIPYIGANGKVIIQIDYAAFGLTEDWKNTLLSKKVNYNGVVGGSKMQENNPDTGDFVGVWLGTVGLLLSGVVVGGYLFVEHRRKMKY